MRTHEVFIHLFDLLFPPSAELRLVRTLSTGDIAYLFHPRKACGAIALSDFRDPEIRALIHEAKFHGNEHAFSLLGKLFLMHLEYSGSIYDCILPVPLSRVRRRSRGYNQVFEVLHRAQKHTLLPLRDDLLKRVRHTRPQTDLSRDERLTNLRGAFHVPYPPEIEGKRILLVDDVITTGATLHAAKAALLPHHPLNVTLLALAH